MAVGPLGPARRQDPGGRGAVGLVGRAGTHAGSAVGGVHQRRSHAGQGQPPPRWHAPVAVGHGQVDAERARGFAMGG